MDTALASVLQQAIAPGLTCSSRFTVHWHRLPLCTTNAAVHLHLCSSMLSGALLRPNPAPNCTAPRTLPSPDAGGRMWPIVFDQVMGMMIIFEVFTGAVLLTNRAWVLSVVLWVTLTPALLVSETL